MDTMQTVRAALRSGRQSQRLSARLIGAAVLTERRELKPGIDLQFSHRRSQHFGYSQIGAEVVGGLEYRRMEGSRGEVRRG
jgi:hypothetical protein